MGIMLLQWESIEPFLSVAITFSTLYPALWVFERGKLARSQSLVLPTAALSLIYSRIFRTQNISQ